MMFRSTVIIITLFSLFCFNNKAPAADSLFFRNGKKIIIKSPNKVKIIKYKRKWLMERSTILLINTTRILTLHQPLLSIGTFRLQKGAYLHSRDMARKDYCGHSGFNRRSDLYHFTGENVAAYYKTGIGFYLGWLFSQGHRENMLSYDYWFTGISIIKTVKIEKKYKNGKLIKRTREAKTYGTNVFR